MRVSRLLDIYREASVLLCHAERQTSFCLPYNILTFHAFVVLSFRVIAPHTHLRPNLPALHQCSQHVLFTVNPSCDFPPFFSPALFVDLFCVSYTPEDFIIYIRCFYPVTSRFSLSKTVVCGRPCPCVCVHINE